MIISICFWHQLSESRMRASAPKLSVAENLCRRSIANSDVDVVVISTHVSYSNKYKICGSSKKEKLSNVIITFG